MSETPENYAELAGPYSTSPDRSAAGSQRPSFGGRLPVAPGGTQLRWGAGSRPIRVRLRYPDTASPRTGEAEIGQGDPRWAGSGTGERRLRTGVFRTATGKRSRSHQGASCAVEERYQERPDGGT